MTPNGLKLLQMTLNGSKWYEMALNGSKQLQMSPNQNWTLVTVGTVVTVVTVVQQNNAYYFEAKALQFKLQLSIPPPQKKTQLERM